LLITRETDYALRILRALSGGQLRSIPQICDEEKIPKQFAYKILKKLSIGGFVQVTRGTTGGCRLIADPSELSLYQIMCATGEEHLINACTNCGYECERRKEMDGDCTIHCHLKEMQSRLDEILQECTLADLLCPNAK